MYFTSPSGVTRKTFRSWKDNKVCCNPNSYMVHIDLQVLSLTCIRFYTGGCTIIKDLFDQLASNLEQARPNNNFEVYSRVKRIKQQQTMSMFAGNERTGGDRRRCFLQHSLLSNRSQQALLSLQKIRKYTREYALVVGSTR